MSTTKKRTRIRKAPSETLASGEASPAPEPAEISETIDANAANMLRRHDRERLSLAVDLHVAALRFGTAKRNHHLAEAASLTADRAADEAETKRAEAEAEYFAAMREHEQLQERAKAAHIPLNLNLDT